MTWQRPKYGGLKQILKALEGIKKAAKLIEEKENKNEKIINDSIDPCLYDNGFCGKSVMDSTG